LCGLEEYHERVVAPLERRVHAARPRSAPTTPVPPPEGQTTTRAGQLRLRAKRLREAAEIIDAAAPETNRAGLVAEVLRCVRDLELEATARQS
jgi:hypothetical protein